MKQDLTCFLSGGPAPLRWLLIESLPYVGRLAAFYPHARLTVITEIPEVADLPEFAGLDIEWHFLDSRWERLPFPNGSFDAVLAENLLTRAYEPYDTLMDISRKLTDVGVLYGDFLNVRYNGVLSALQKGEFPVREKHLYAKSEMVRLLDDTLFKEIDFVPGEKDADESAARAWEQKGYANINHELAVSRYLFRAAISTARVANLKSLYTPEVRKELARILHRIEYDVQREENITRLQCLCQQEGIFPDYLQDFIEGSCLHAKNLRYLWENKKI
ncbi:Methyltransferase domain-containing protein [Selenomonas ruminantium]|uniref:Methyltransferase domain-containing protein n=1 Tax=Selenomonas ruminantium TaxID=971 RepID=A0A1M6XWM9_SELRU|nr:class I SAM-dependent methyltransferase [Selenomonas ruminantium]SHL10258.1 Methyltransferase domain-containing protein [Selenomonas ruminantium]